MSGVVVDSQGRPVANVSVQVVTDTSCATTSAEDGRFELPCARVGERISVQRDGVRTVEVPAAERPLRVVVIPAPYSEAVIVTATRTDQRTTSPAAPVSVITSADLAVVPPAPLDDALRSVPGFSLFRRTTSRSANPTTQGAGLRGLSASGASRALVLADGEPLNDPFGGWVYWNRIPQTAIERVEVVRGGASDLYGADALAGVLQVVTLRPLTPSGRFELTGASRETGRLSAFGGAPRGRWSATGGAEGFNTDGYIQVGEADRGAVDTPAGGRYGSVRGDAQYTSGNAFYARLGGDSFGERRDNGTPLQTNSTDLRQLRFGLGGSAGRTAWRLSGQAGDQTYRQVFSSIAADRSRETLTVQQRVPASQHGLAFSVQTRLRALDVLAGADTRDTAATNVERGFFPDGRLRATTSIQGFQRNSGVYLQGGVDPGPRLRVTAGVRADVRQRTRDEGWLDGDSAVSPRAAVAWNAAPWAVVHAGLGWSFRAPTLNERYRGFRVGNAETQPNPNLVPERLRTLEGAVLLRPRAGALRITLFRNDLDNAVTNVTIATTPQLITRRRQNVGGIAAWGSEVEGEWRVSSRATLTGALALTRSRFVDYAPLEGLRVPQVPGWQTTVGARGAGPFGLVLATQLRAFGKQFEDDRNTLVLGRGVVVDATAIRPIGSRVSAFVSLENLFDDDYEVGRTPVPTYGQPFTAHAGVRFTLP